MNTKQLSIILGVIVVALLAVVGYMYLQGDSETDTLSQEDIVQKDDLLENTKPENPVSNTQTQQPTDSTPTPTTKDETQSWKTYTNTNLGFTLKYPPSKPVAEELNDEYNRLVLFKGSGDDFFEVRLLDEGPNPSMSAGYLDAVVVDKNIQLDGIVGYKAVSETGYGDAGVQGSPYVDFGVRRGIMTYHLIFYGDTKISSEEQLVINSFKFTN